MDTPSLRIFLEELNQYANDLEQALDEFENANEDEDLAEDDREEVLDNSTQSAEAALSIIVSHVGAIDVQSLIY